MRQRAWLQEQLLPSRGRWRSRKGRLEAAGPALPSGTETPSGRRWPWAPGIPTYQALFTLKGSRCGDRSYSPRLLFLHGGGVLM